MKETDPSCGVEDSGGTRPLMCPLNQVRAGSFVRVRRLSASPEMSDRLRELGFCEDQRIKLVSQQTNVICQVCNVRLAISHELAQQILVEPVPAQKRVA
ncbi:MAG: ferrous iron transport protein A [Verrucomicrobia bacterium]|nr:ferrous iron transport protein A [Verrucomicrobiota bacterium]